MMHGKIYPVEFLRFFFSILIVYFHILHNNILPQVEHIPAYAILSKQCVNTGYIVECFFIISGYFLVNSIRNEKSVFFHFALKKIFRLWPVLAFSTLCSFAFISFNAKNILTQFLNLLFLQNTGLSLYHTGINWYISPLFWVMLFYYGVSKISGGVNDIF